MKNPGSVKKYGLIGLVLSIVWLAGCRSGHDYPEAMQRAIACMESDPDSAQIYLASLDSVIAGEPEETRMYHALLTAKVAYKHYCVPDSDSLMRKVVRFYEQYGDADKLTEAYYYLSTFYQERQDVVRAVRYCQQAAETGENSENHVLLSRIYADWGTLLAYQGLYEEALKHYRISYFFATKCSHQSSEIYALRNIGRMFDVLHQQDSAVYYYQEAYQTALAVRHARSILSLGQELGNLYLDLGCVDSARALFTHLPENLDNALYLRGKGRLCQLSGQLDSARFYYLEALKPGKQIQNMYVRHFIHRQLLQIECEERHWETACNHAEMAMALDDTITDLTRTETIGKLQSLYSYQHIEKENQRLQLRQQRLINNFVCLGTFFLLLAAWIYIRHHQKLSREKEQALRLLAVKEEQNRQSQARIDENNVKIASVESDLQQLSIEKNSLQRILKETQKKLLIASNQQIQMRWSEKELLEKQFHESSIYLFFHQYSSLSQSGSCQITDQHWTDLRTQLDITYEQFTDRLYSLYPQISDFELRICYLIKIQIPTKNIAKILNRSLSAISNARSRLYKRIHNEEGKPDQLDRFIVDF